MLELADPARPVGERICAVAGELLGADRTSLTLVAGRNSSAIVGSDAGGVLLDEQQLALGEGPTFDAIDSYAPVVGDDLTGLDNAHRWPAFAPVGVRHGMAAVYAFPLRVGEARIGVLSAYRTRAGTLTALQYADGLVIASLATVALLQEQSGVTSGDLAEAFLPGLHNQSQIQMAAGMVSEHLGVSIVDALVRIRGHAFQTAQAVNVVARAIVARDLVLEP